MKRRRSASVSAALVAQMALLVGCDGGDLDRMAEGPTQAQICADKDGVIVPDEMCQNMNQQQQTAAQSGGGATVVYPYGWYYYPYYYGGSGYSGGSARIGDRLPSTANRAPVAGIQAVRPNSPGFGLRGGSSFSGGGS